MGLIESFFDAAEKVVGGAEKAVSIKEGNAGLWQVEAISEEDGTDSYIVTNGTKKLETKDESLANHVAGLLNG